jgi:uncharacterized protein (TIGR00725 family)
MAAADARSRDGLVIGIRPGDSREGASPCLSATIATSLGEARNAVIIWSADAVTLVGGSGTLSELELAKRRGEIPAITLGGWQNVDAGGQHVPGVETAISAEETLML